MSADSFSQRERELLTRIQSGFPLVAEPYAALAIELGDTAAGVQASVQRLRRTGVIRRIGGSFAAPALGYVSTLAGARVAPDAIAGAAAVASGFPEVTHNYEREGEVNLWFTVIAPDQARLEHILDRVRQAPGVLALYDLPARRRFKIRVEFRLTDGPAADAAAVRPEEDGDGRQEPITLDATDRRLICRACGDLDDGPRPFGTLAAAAGVTESEGLARLERYRQAGAMRRFGAVLHHRAAGVTANGMSAWNVPDGGIQRVGEAMAACPDVSHCYERPRLPGWPYNLLAMIHGRDRTTCLTRAARLAADTGISDYQVLFSAREFKKTSMVYFPEALSTDRR